jgi:hypothetical protein
MFSERGNASETEGLIQSDGRVLTVASFEAKDGVVKGCCGSLQMQKKRSGNSQPTVGRQNVHAPHFCDLCIEPPNSTTTDCDSI